MSGSPTNLALERRVLIAAIAHKNDAVRIAVLSKTKIDDFGSSINKEIRKRLEFKLNQNKLPSSIEEMANDPGLSEKARKFLSNIKQKDIIKYSRIKKNKLFVLIEQLKQYWKARKIYESYQEISDILKEGTYGEEEIKKVNDLLDSLVQDTRQSENINSYIIKSRQNKQDAGKFVKSVMRVGEKRFVEFGIDALDINVGGATRGDLVVISAPRGGGKTALMLQAATSQFTKYGLNVALWSLEMSKEQLKERLLASVTGEYFADIRVRKKNNIDYMRELARKWYNFMKDYEGNGKLTIWDVSDAACKPTDLKKTVLPFGYDCIWVDYLTLFSAGGKELWLAQKEYSRFFKQLAKELDTVIVLLTQLSDNERVKYGRGPEEDADWWLWWKYGEEEIARGGETEIKLAKARNASRGYIPATFDMPTMQVRFGTTINIMSKYNTSIGKMNMKKKGSGSDVEEDFDI